MLCPEYILFFILCIFHKQVLGQCPQNCASCSRSDDAQKCDICNYGYWSKNDSYCSPCPQNCKQCTNASQCTICKSGFWDIRPNLICGSPCDETCTASRCNDTTGYCLGCHPGFYGRHCDRSCGLCINKLCNHQRCMTGCIDGYYESTGNGFECKKCHDHCSSCVSLTNCTQCERGYFLFSYEHSDDSFCAACNPACETCISYSECVCQSGKYGPTCSKDCNISNCTSCIEVDSVVKCTECISGYTVLNGYCVPGTNLCSQYCSNGCDSNQNCLGGCQNGWTGQKCTEMCADQCGKCDQNDGKDCKICKGDFYTAACTLPCSLHCSTITGLPRCNINNGTCLNGCDKGYWGVKCNKTCNEGCSSESCNQSDGFCDTCNRTHYGDACQNKCSEYCIDNDDPSTICYKTNGTCVHGCKDGYRGNICEDELTVSTIVTLSSSTDNVALLADTVYGLQRQLNMLSDFCDTFRLKVNEGKTKLVVFKNGGVLARNEKWRYKDAEIEVVDTFGYVGLTFTRQISMNCSMDLEIEKGRYTNTARENRKCKLCDTNSVEDVCHFLLRCGCYRDLRELHIPNKYYTRPDVNKFNILMSTRNEELIKLTAVFLYYAFEKRKKLLQTLLEQDI
ncbi:proprotein convertase subtilisin/kexin type 5-like [Mercenaria mercenaria]|uniref:proprotein convertase subtilisin/kexin type 5-like n=1 Tax=Mercenaria mercenaria TaxID=6596 RepID=UPI00234FA3D7|nr:proprotein convertase subtilisin/kexin type 5-like [Mercenaria mercenaria]